MISIWFTKIIQLSSSSFLRTQQETDLFKSSLVEPCSIHHLGHTPMHTDQPLRRCVATHKHYSLTSLSQAYTLNKTLILTIFCVGRPAPCPAFTSIRAIIGLVCGLLFSILKPNSYCIVCQSKTGFNGKKKREDAKSKQDIKTNRNQLECMKWDNSIIMISS